MADSRIFHNKQKILHDRHSGPGQSTPKLEVGGSCNSEIWGRQGVNTGQLSQVSLASGDQTSHPRKQAGQAQGQKVEPWATMQFGCDLGFRLYKIQLTLDSGRSFLGSQCLLYRTKGVCSDRTSPAVCPRGTSPITSSIWHCWAPSILSSPSPGFRAVQPARVTLCAAQHKGSLLEELAAQGILDGASYPHLMETT